MNGLKVFENEEFGSIRTLEIDGEPWFVGKDVAEVLGYSNASKAVITHVDYEDKRIEILPNSQNGNTVGKITLINESGLYSLILSSKLPKAKEFKHWVTSEVLPSIRKHGAYMTPKTLMQALQNPDAMIQILETLKSEQDKNRELETINKALTRQEHEWNNRNILNALVRAYGAKCCNGIWGAAWNEFYKQLKYKYSIDLKTRSGISKRKTSMIDLLSVSEMEKAVSLAAAMCEMNGINTAKVINDVNYTNIIDIAS